MVAPDNDDPDNPSTLSTHRYKFDHKLNLRNKGKGSAAFSLTFGPFARSCGFGSAMTQAAPTMVDVMKTHPDFSPRVSQQVHQGAPQVLYVARHATRRGRQSSNRRDPQDSLRTAKLRPSNLRDSQ